jgi:hypothetical protein
MLLSAAVLTALTDLGFPGNIASICGWIVKFGQTPEGKQRYQCP